MNNHNKHQCALAKSTSLCNCTFSMFGVLAMVVVVNTVVMGNSDGKHVFTLFSLVSQFGAMLW